MTRVLIIEDHADMRDLLVWQVELMGFTALSANNASDGIETATAEKPDLILLDIMMPNLDGLAAARRLRACRTTRTIPILAATALFRESDLNACTDAGCTTYIVKPFTFAELRRKIREIIPASQSR